MGTNCTYVEGRWQKGFQENRSAAIEGGSAAGAARETYENQTGTKVVSNKNAKLQIEEAKKLAAQQKKLEEKEKIKKDNKKSK